MGTFYYYFTAKEDIYDQIISEAADHMEKAIAAIPPQKSPRDFVTQVFYCYAERNMQMGTDLHTRMQMDLLTSQSGKTPITTSCFIPWTNSYSVFRKKAGLIPM